MTEDEMVVWHHQLKECEFREVARRLIMEELVY